MGSRRSYASRSAAQALYTEEDAIRERAKTGDTTPAPPIALAGIAVYDLSQHLGAFL
jgi:hypothetical protein